MWHDHPDLFMNKLEEILNTPVDSDFGNFIEVVLKCPDEIKWKARNFPFCYEIKICKKMNLVNNEKKPDTHTRSEKLYRDWTKKEVFGSVQYF